MCDPVTAGLLLTAAGGGAKAVNNNQALRRKDREAAEGIRRQGRLQADSNRAVDERVADIAASTGDAERTQSLDGFLNALRTSQDDTEGALDSVVGANPRFAERVSAGKGRIAREGTSRAGRLSRIDAPIFQRRNEANRVARTGSDLGELNRRSTAEDFLTRLRVSEETPNALVDILGSISEGAGSALALGSGSFLNSGGANLGKLAKAGTLIDAPIRRAPTIFSGLA